MAKHSVDVLIKARDKASKKFGIIGVSARVMGKALKGAASITKTAFVEAFRVAKYAVMGLAAAFTYATYAAMTQEDAELSLKGVLIGLGTYTKELMVDYKRFASAMQEATTWGDEYVLSLLKVAAAQTDNSEAAKELVSDTLALIGIVPAGKMKPLAFMKMVLGFKKGLMDLDSYLVALKGVTDENERQRIYTEKLAAGWGLWNEKIKTARSSLTRTWNVIGDVAEKIGEPFLQNITNSAVAVKNWAKQNEDNIAHWAKRFHVEVIYIKDVFIDFAKFMREDWRSGLAFVFDSFLKLLRTTFESAVTLAIAGGKGIWKGVKEGMLGEDAGAISRKMEEISRRRETAFRRYEEQWRGERRPGFTPPFEPPEGAGRIYGPELEALAKKELAEAKTKSILGNSIRSVTDAFKESFEEILKDMPGDFRKAVDKAWAERLKRLEKLGPLGKKGAEAGAAPPFVRTPLKDAIGKIAAGIKQSLRPLEARFLMFAPGKKFGKAEQDISKTAKNTGQIVRHIASLVKETRGYRYDFRQYLDTAGRGVKLLVSNFS